MPVESLQRDSRTYLRRWCEAECKSYIYSNAADLEYCCQLKVAVNEDGSPRRTWNRVNDQDDGTVVNQCHIYTEGITFHPLRIEVQYDKDIRQDNTWKTPVYSAAEIHCRNIPVVDTTPAASPQMNLIAEVSRSQGSLVGGSLSNLVEAVKTALNTAGLEKDAPASNTTDQTPLVEPVAEATKALKRLTAAVEMAAIAAGAIAMITMLVIACSGRAKAVGETNCAAAEGSQSGSTLGGSN